MIKWIRTGILSIKNSLPGGSEKGALDQSSLEEAESERLADDAVPSPPKPSTFDSDPQPLTLDRLNPELTIPTPKFSVWG